MIHLGDQLGLFTALKDAGEPISTAELAARTDVTHFTKAAACGTSTEVSVPCMFSPHGRADYDESRIRLTDSALHVIARAGVQACRCCGATTRRAARASAAGCGKRT
jgi:rRNA maturation protein Nop10